jgi:hypothetical protein
MRYLANPGNDYNSIINLEEDEKKNSVAVEDAILRVRALNAYKKNFTVIDSHAIKTQDSLEEEEPRSIFSQISAASMMGGTQAMLGAGSGGGGSSMMGDSMMGGGDAMMGGDAMAKGSSAGGGAAMTKGSSMTGGGDQMMMTTMGKGRNAKKMILTRASELNQPADFAHFLHKFGQSERNYQVNAVSKEGSIPQIMELMNGYASGFVASPQSMLFKNVRRARLRSQRASNVFLSILNRRPNEDERKIIVDLETNDSAISDLIWALLNSPEFLFIQ